MDAFTCPSCGAPLSADDLDRRFGIITCSHCSAIFDLSRRSAREGAEGERADVSAVAAPVGARPPVALPDRFRVAKRRGELTISWRWFRLTYIFLLFFTAAWDGFLFFWYSTAVTDGAPLFAILFPLGHVAVGVGLTYFTLAGFLNTTTVRVTGGTLTVRHRPLPWSPAPTIRAFDVEQLYVERKVKRGKNGTSVTFSVLAVTRAHRGRKLVAGLDELDQALYLEQEIEDVLAIKDRAVAGEYRAARAHV